MADGSSLLLTFTIWIGLNAADAVWIYYYVQSSLLPVSYNLINHSTHARDGFAAMMFIFGFFLSSINVMCAWWYFGWVHKNSWQRSKTNKTLRIYSSIFLALPCWTFMVVMPFAGGWIVSAIVEKHAWQHWCDTYPMFAILDGTSHNDPSYVIPRAYFYINSPSPSSPTQLFTYELTNPGSGDTWLFDLRSFEQPQSSIPLDVYPTLQQVSYNYNLLDVTGNCTLPDPTSANNTNTTTLPCLTGTFDPGSKLFFNLTSSIPLNSTTANVYPAGVHTANTTLTISNNVWAINHYPPAVRLQEINNIDGLGRVVLKTTVTKPHDETELKVCIAGVEGHEAGTVTAEVLAPLGVVLLRQQDYAQYATEPNDSD